MFSIDIRGGLPIYEQLKLRITELISSGVLTQDERLPTVREVAKELGINPNTVQKTYQSLEREGLIYSIPAKGSYVSKSDKLTDMLKEQAMGKFKESAKNAVKCGIEITILIKELENFHNEGGRIND